MADSLDDFFAKRDKTKKKSKSNKSKFVAADLLPPTPTDSATIDDNTDQLAEVKIEEDRPEPVVKEKKKSKKKKDKDGTDEKNEVQPVSSSLATAVKPCCTTFPHILPSLICMKLFS